MNKRRCIRCGFCADEDEFRQNPDLRSRIHARGLRAVCIGCEQDDRDRRKRGSPWPAKARSTIAHHAAKYNLPVAGFCREYGWTTGRVAHMLKHAFENTCPYCWKFFCDMRNQHADVTVDIVDPSKPPWLRTNVQVCCRTCNTAKSNMTPERWERRLRFWRERKEYLDSLEANPTVGLPLFGWRQGVLV